eukprot:g2061.t1
MSSSSSNGGGNTFDDFDAFMQRAEANDGNPFKSISSDESGTTNNSETLENTDESSSSSSSLASIFTLRNTIYFSLACAVGFSALVVSRALMASDEELTQTTTMVEEKKHQEELEEAERKKQQMLRQQQMQQRMRQQMMQQGAQVQGQGKKGSSAPGAVQAAGASAVAVQQWQVEAEAMKQNLMKVKNVYLNLVAGGRHAEAKEAKIAYIEYKDRYDLFIMKNASKQATIPGPNQAFYQATLKRLKQQKLNEITHIRNELSQDLLAGRNEDARRGCNEILRIRKNFFVSIVTGELALFAIEFFALNEIEQGKQLCLEIVSIASQKAVMQYNLALALSKADAATRAAAAQQRGGTTDPTAFRTNLSIAWGAYFTLIVLAQKGLGNDVRSKDTVPIIKVIPENVFADLMAVTTKIYHLVKVKGNNSSDSNNNKLDKGDVDGTKNGYEILKKKSETEENFLHQFAFSQGATAWYHLIQQAMMRRLSLLSKAATAQGAGVAGGSKGVTYDSIFRNFGRLSSLIIRHAVSDLSDRAYHKFLTPETSYRVIIDYGLTFVGGENAGAGSSASTASSLPSNNNKNSVNLMKPLTTLSTLQRCRYESDRLVLDPGMASKTGDYLCPGGGWSNYFLQELENSELADPNGSYNSKLFQGNQPWEVFQRKFVGQLDHEMYIRNRAKKSSSPANSLGNPKTELLLTTVPYLTKLKGDILKVARTPARVIGQMIEQSARYHNHVLCEALLTLRSLNSPIPSRKDVTLQGISSHLSNNYHRPQYTAEDVEKKVQKAIIAFRQCVDSLLSWHCWLIEICDKIPTLPVKEEEGDDNSTKTKKKVRSPENVVTYLCTSDLDLESLLADAYACLLSRFWPRLFFQIIFRQGTGSLPLIQGNDLWVFQNMTAIKELVDTAHANFRAITIFDVNHLPTNTGGANDEPKALHPFVAQLQLKTRTRLAQRSGKVNVGLAKIEREFHNFKTCFAQVRTLMAAWARGFDNSKGLGKTFEITSKALEKCLPSKTLYAQVDDERVRQMLIDQHNNYGDQEQADFTSLALILVYSLADFEKSGLYLENSECYLMYMAVQRSLLSQQFKRMKVKAVEWSNKVAEKNKSNKEEVAVEKKAEEDSNKDANLETTTSSSSSSSEVSSKINKEDNQTEEGEIKGSDVTVTEEKIEKTKEVSSEETDKKTSEMKEVSSEETDKKTSETNEADSSPETSKAYKQYLSTVRSEIGKEWITSVRKMLVSAKKLKPIDCRVKDSNVSSMLETWRTALLKEMRNLAVTSPKIILGLPDVEEIMAADVVSSVGTENDEDEEKKQSFDINCGLATEADFFNFFSSLDDVSSGTNALLRKQLGLGSMNTGDLRNLVEVCLLSGDVELATRLSMYYAKLRSVQIFTEVQISLLQSIEKILVTFWSRAKEKAITDRVQEAQKSGELAQLTGKNNQNTAAGATHTIRPKVDQLKLPNSMESMRILQKLTASKPLDIERKFYGSVEQCVDVFKLLLSQSQSKFFLFEDVFQVVFLHLRWSNAHGALATILSFYNSLKMKFNNERFGSCTKKGADASSISTSSSEESGEKDNKGGEEESNEETTKDLSSEDTESSKKEDTESSSKKEETTKDGDNTDSSKNDNGKSSQNFRFTTDLIDAIRLRNHELMNKFDGKGDFKTFGVGKGLGKERTDAMDKAKIVRLEDEKELREKLLNETLWSNWIFKACDLCTRFVLSTLGDDQKKSIEASETTETTGTSETIETSENMNAVNGSGSIRGSIIVSSMNSWCGVQLSTNSFVDKVLLRQCPSLLESSQSFSLSKSKEDFRSAAWYMNTALMSRCESTVKACLDWVNCPSIEASMFYQMASASSSGGQAKNVEQCPSRGECLDALYYCYLSWKVWDHRKANAAESRSYYRDVATDIMVLASIVYKETALDCFAASPLCRVSSLFCEDDCVTSKYAQQNPLPQELGLLPYKKDTASSSKNLSPMKKAGAAGVSSPFGVSRGNSATSVREEQRRDQEEIIDAAKYRVFTWGPNDTRIEDLLSSVSSVTYRSNQFLNGPQPVSTPKSFEDVLTPASNPTNDEIFEVAETVRLSMEIYLPSALYLAGRSQCCPKGVIEQMHMWKDGIMRALDYYDNLVSLFEEQKRKLQIANRSSSGTASSGTGSDGSHTLETIGNDEMTIIVDRALYTSSMFLSPFYYNAKNTDQHLTENIVLKIILRIIALVFAHTAGANDEDINNDAADEFKKKDENLMVNAIAKGFAAAKEIAESVLVVGERLLKSSNIERIGRSKQDAFISTIKLRWTEVVDVMKTLQTSLDASLPPTKRPCCAQLEKHLYDIIPHVEALANENSGLCLLQIFNYLSNHAASKAKGATGSGSSAYNFERYSRLQSLAVVTAFSLYTLAPSQTSALQQTLKQLTRNNLEMNQIAQQSFSHADVGKELAGLYMNRALLLMFQQGTGKECDADYDTQKNRDEEVRDALRQACKTLATEFSAFANTLRDATEKAPQQIGPIAMQGVEVIAVLLSHFFQVQAIECILASSDDDNKNGSSSVSTKSTKSGTTGLFGDKMMEKTRQSLLKLDEKLTLARARVTAISQATVRAVKTIAQKLNQPGSAMTPMQRAQSQQQYMTQMQALQELEQWTNVINYLIESIRDAGLFQIVFQEYSRKHDKATGATAQKLLEPLTAVKARLSEMPAWSATGVPLVQAFHHMLYMFPMNESTQISAKLCRSRILRTLQIVQHFSKHMEADGNKTDGSPKKKDSPAAVESASAIPNTDVGGSSGNEAAPFLLLGALEERERPFTRLYMHWWVLFRIGEYKQVLDGVYKGFLEQKEIWEHEIGDNDTDASTKALTPRLRTMLLVCIMYGVWSVGLMDKDEPEISEMLRKEKEMWNFMIEHKNELRKAINTAGAERWIYLWSRTVAIWVVQGRLDDATKAIEEEFAGNEYLVGRLKDLFLPSLSNNSRKAVETEEKKSLNLGFSDLSEASAGLDWTKDISCEEEEEEEERTSSTKKIVISLRTSSGSRLLQRDLLRMCMHLSDKERCHTDPSISVRDAIKTLISKW